MALSYPHTEVFDTDGKTLTFKDGFELTIPEMTFRQQVEVTIDKTSVDPFENFEPLTGAYTFSGDPNLLGDLHDNARLRIPFDGELPEPDELAVFAADAGENWPEPEDWDSRSDIGVDAQNDSLLVITDELVPLYVASTAAADLTYPHTVTLDSRARTLTFADGLQIDIPEGTFDDPVEVTVEKLDVDAISGGLLLTDPYVFDGPAESLQNLSKDVHLSVPLTGELPNIAAVNLRGTDPGEEHPKPDSWDPDPDADVDVESFDAEVSDLNSFYVAFGGGGDSH